MAKERTAQVDDGWHLDSVVGMRFLKERNEREPVNFLNNMLMRLSIGCIIDIPIDKLNSRLPPSHYRYHNK